MILQLVLYKFIHIIHVHNKRILHKILNSIIIFYYIIIITVSIYTEIL